jgi:Holliday junction resolvase-like predicted endonuclease
MARIQLEFEALAPQMLENLNFVVGRINGAFRRSDYESDFVARRDGLSVLVEVKFYKSRDSSPRAVTIASRLLRSLCVPPRFRSKRLNGYSFISGKSFTRFIRSST